MILFYVFVFASGIGAIMSTDSNDLSDDFPGGCVSPDNDMGQYTDTFSDPAGLVIFPDLPLTCSGFIEKYQFYPINYGTVFVGIFRPYFWPSSGKYLWELKGFNKVVVDESMTLNTWHLSNISDKHLQVKEDDVIGLITYANATKQVIGYKEEDEGSRMIRSHHTRKNLVRGDFIETTEDSRRGTFGLNAMIRHNTTPAPPTTTATTPTTTATTTAAIPGAALVTSLVYQGCFRDDVHDRDFNQTTKWVDMRRMTIALCAAHCDALNHSYFGLQNAYGCRCGDSYRDSSPSTGCNTPCRGLLSTMCGGQGKNSVYKILHQQC